LQHLDSLSQDSHLAAQSKQQTQLQQKASQISQNEVLFQQVLKTSKDKENTSRDNQEAKMATMAAADQGRESLLASQSCSNTSQQLYRME